MCSTPKLTHCPSGPPPRSGHCPGPVGHILSAGPLPWPGPPSLTLAAQCPPSWLDVLQARLVTGQQAAGPECHRARELLGRSLSPGSLSVVPMGTSLGTRRRTQCCGSGGPASLFLLPPEKTPVVTYIPETGHPPVSQYQAFLGDPGPLCCVPSQEPRRHGDATRLRVMACEHVLTRGLGVVCVDTPDPRAWGSRLLAGCGVYVLDSGTLPTLPGRGGVKGGWRVHPTPRPPGWNGLFSRDKRFALIGVSRVCRSLVSQNVCVSELGAVVWAPHSVH